MRTVFGREIARPDTGPAVRFGIGGHASQIDDYWHELGQQLLQRPRLVKMAGDSAPVHKHASHTDLGLVGIKGGHPNGPPPPESGPSWHQPRQMPSPTRMNRRWCGHFVRIAIGPRSTHLNFDNPLRSLAIFHDGKRQGFADTLDRIEKCVELRTQIRHRRSAGRAIGKQKNGVVGGSVSIDRNGLNVPAIAFCSAAWRIGWGHSRIRREKCEHGGHLRMNHSGTLRATGDSNFLATPRGTSQSSI